MEDKGLLKISKFAGVTPEWLGWKVQLMSAFVVSDFTLFKALKDPPSEPEAVEAKLAWQELSCKVYARLILCTSGPANDLVLQFCDTMNGLAAWAALSAKYELTGDVQKAALQEEMMRDVMGEHEDPDVYFLRLERVWRQLKTLGVHKEDDGSLLMGTARAKLPDNYKSLKTVLDATSDLDYDTFKVRVRTFYQREVMSAKEDGEALMMQFRGKCFACDAFGHKKGSSECPKRNGSGSGNGGGRANGGRGNGRNGGRGNGRNGGRGGGRKRCTHCHKDGHLVSECYKLQNETANSANVTHVTLAAIEDGAEPESVNTWLLDSGCSRHMVSSTNGITNLQRIEGDVITASGDKVASIGMGDLKLVSKDVQGRKVNLTLSNVLVVPKLSRNLLSVKKMTTSGANVSFGPSGGIIEINGTRIPVRHAGQLYEVNLQLAAPSAMTNVASSDEPANVAVDAGLWHRRLGHRNSGDMAKLGTLDVGVPKGLTVDGPCEVCEVSKHTHASFPKTADRDAKGPLDVVHTDVAGSMEVESYGGARYVIAFTDEATRWRMAYPMKRKSDALKCLKQYVTDMAGLLGGLRAKALMADNGGEFISKEFIDWAKSQGIGQRRSAPHAPQQNGVAERSFRLIMEMARCLMAESGMDKQIWAEAVNTAVYLINRLPTAALNGDTPYHALFGKHAKMGHLRTFGCRAFVHVYDGDRKKLDPKAWKGIFVGYDDSNRTCYRIFDPSKGQVVRSVHVTFDESHFPDKITTTPIITDPTPSVVPKPEAVDSVGDATGPAAIQPVGDGAKPTIIQPAPSEPIGDGGTGMGAGEMDDIQEELFGRGHRARKPTYCQEAGCRTKGQHMAHVARVHMALQDTCGPDDEARFAADYAFTASGGNGDPNSYEEAMMSANAQHWIKAADAEHEALVKQKTWFLVKKPPGANVIGVKWVFKTKLDEHGKVARYKARLVAQGYSQEPGRDYFETYAPVAKLSSIRAVLAICAVENWHIHNMDVDTAFLQSPVYEEIYVKQPKGYEIRGANGEELVCRVLKSLYGLKQSPRNWNKVLNEWLQSYELVPLPADPCVFIFVTDEGTLIIIIYVDDLIIAGSCQRLIDEFKAAISARFNMKDLGPLVWMLGMQIVRDRLKRTIVISQTAYIDRVVEKFGMSDCKPVATPAEGVLSRETCDGEGSPDGEYMSLVGSLLYAAMVTRPDIAYAVQALGRHLQASGPEHWMAAKRVLRYLKGTRDMGIVYGLTDDSLELHGYCDADWGGDRDTRRSTTAYVFMLAGGAVSWGSKLQPTVALSSAEAEYMAACSAVQEAVYMRRLLSGLGYQGDVPTIIYEDNQGCIALSENPVLHKRTKHIDIRYHFTREKVESGEVVLEYIPTEHQLADLLTKALLRHRVTSLRDQVMGYI